VTIAIVICACAAALLGGAHWSNIRLGHERNLARTRATEATAQRLNSRRAQYVADIRLVRTLIEDHNAYRAIECLERHVPKPGELEMREFAWHYLRRRADTSRNTLRGFTDAVYHVEFSPRGDLVAAASKDGSVRIWETKGWQPVRAMIESGPEVNVATFSPDGKNLATVDDDGKLKLWEIVSGRLEWETIAHTGDAVIALFTSDGTRVITGGRKDGLVKMWDSRTGAPFGALPPVGADLENATLSPDGSILATVATDAIRLWNWSTGKAVAARAVEHAPQDLAFTHDGRFFALSDTPARGASLHDASQQRVLREFNGHTGGVYPLAFSRDDRTLISGSDDFTIRLWDVSTGAHRGVLLGHTGKVWDVAVSPDGRTVASASDDGTVKIWDPEPRREYETIALDQPVSAVRFSPDSKTLATLEKSGRLSWWDTDTRVLKQRRELAQQAPAPKIVWFAGTAEFSRDLRSLLIANSEGAVSFWDAERGRRVADLSATKDPAHTLQFTRDGRHACVTRNGNRLEFWNLIEHKLLNVTEDDFYCSVMFSDGDRIVADAFSRRALVLWEPQSAQLREPSRIEFRPRCVTLSSDQSLLAFQNTLSGPLNTRQVQLVDTQRWLLIPISFRSPIEQTSLAFDPTDRTLAGGAADGYIRLWDVPTGEELLTLKGRAGNSMGKTLFSPDGRTLEFHVTAAGGHTEVLLWHASEEQDSPTNANNPSLNAAN
jgi:WD40 repeat protein